MTLQAMVCAISVVRSMFTHMSQGTNVVVARPDDSSDQTWLSKHMWLSVITLRDFS